MSTTLTQDGFYGRQSGDAPTKWYMQILASRIDGRAEVIADYDDSGHEISMPYRARVIDDLGLSTYIFRGNRLEDAIAAMEAAQ